jgi:zinc transport system substrate-binding protein
MQKLFVFILLLLPAVLGAEPLRVFVSVPPQKTFVEKIGGAHVEVRTMVRPGHDPHTYAPTPQQVSALAQADLYIRIGVPFEHAWMKRIRSANPAMQVLDARTDIELRDMAHHDHDAEEVQAGDHHHEHKGERTARDPHIWTSPPLVTQMARAIRDRLAGLDPAHARDYARNHDAFAAELKALDGELRSLLEHLPNRRFMVFHPAWGYFADTYGLTQVPIEREGKAPGARALATLIEQARREKVKVVFVQPQFDKRSARQVARAIGGSVVAIDPLAADYADNLRRAARRMAEALQP